MSERVSDTNRRLFVVSPLPEEAADVQLPPVGKWAAYIRIDPPEGVDPRFDVSHYIMRRVDRVCGVDLNVPYIGLTYSLTAERPDDVEADADKVLDEILGWLKLDRTAVRHGEILELNHPTPDDQIEL